MEQFAQYLVEAIAGRFQIKWMRRGGLNGSAWSVTTLGEAFRDYNWNGADFPVNARELATLREALAKSLASRDGAALGLAVGEILKWGGVLQGGNRAWLAGLDGSNLVARICGACEMLQTEPFDSAAFAKAGFRSNAGLTKVYALALENFAIFDSRVSAALQMLVCMFARERGLQEVPEALRLHAMPAKSAGIARRAAFNRTRFPSTYNNTAAHISSNRLANQMLSGAISQASGSSGAEWCVGHEDKLRRLEAALFMVGYNLPPEFA